jgi:hypothetical protein
MTPFRRLRRRSLLPRPSGLAATAAMIAALAAVATSPARADVTVVTETTVTGLPAAARAMIGSRLPESGKPTTTTTYYKGDKQRIESDDAIALYDSATDTLITLNPGDKTYTRRKLTEVMNRFRSGVLHTYLKVDTKTNQFQASPDTKPIAGQTAREVTYALGVHEYPDPSIGDALPIPDATIDCKGEWWYADSLPVPATLGPAQRTGFLLNFMLSGVGALMMGNGLDSIADQIAALHALPLSSRMEFTFTPKDKQAAAESGIPALDAPIVVVNEAKSISTDPLADSLFTIPADYTPAERKPAPSAAPGTAPAPAADGAPSTK